jgi:hypothetical protein
VVYGEALLGSVGYNLVIAIIALVIALAFEEMLYFDTATIEGGPEEFSRITQALRARGLPVAEEPGRHTVRGPIEAQLSLVTTDQGSVILKRMRVAPWFLAAVFIVIALNVVIGLALAFLGYLYYRNVRSALESTLAQGREGQT